MLIKELTPAMEDYLKCIYTLIQQKGYARVIDIAEKLNLRESSVSKMIKRLSKEQYLVYERYRGFTLTSKGEQSGKWLIYRHQILTSFLETIGVNPENLEREADGIEHHLSENSTECMAKFMKQLDEDTQRTHKLKERQRAGQHVL